MTCSRPKRTISTISDFLPLGETLRVSYFVPVNSDSVWGMLWSCQQETFKPCLNKTLLALKHRNSKEVNDLTCKVLITVPWTMSISWKNSPSSFRVGMQWTTTCVSSKETTFCTNMSASIAILKSSVSWSKSRRIKDFPSDATRIKVRFPETSKVFSWTGMNFKCCWENLPLKSMKTWDKSRPWLLLLMQ